MSGFRVLLAALALFCGALPAWAQTKEELGNIFFTLDQNRDGVIELGEVPDASLPVFRSMLSAYDANRNLKLTLEECQLTSSALPAQFAPRGEPLQNPPPAPANLQPQQPGAPVQSPPQAAPPGVDSADALFKQLDSNQDGIITRREAVGTPLLPLFTQMQISQLDLATFRSLQGRKNRDGNPRSGSPIMNGRLGSLEPGFRANPPGIQVLPPVDSITEQQNPPQQKPVSPGLIAALDRDGNGKLTVVELAMLPRVFSTLDVNGDAELDEKELFGSPRENVPAAVVPESTPPAPPQPGAPVSSPPVTPENAPSQPESPAKPVELPASVPEQPAAAAPENQAATAARIAALKLFTPLDADGDGLLTDAERPEWWLPAMFTAMDADHDGKVSRDEYAGYFIRSQRRPTGDANPPME